MQKKGVIKDDAIKNNNIVESAVPSFLSPMERYFP